MDSKDVLKQTLATTNMVVTSYLSDLSDADLMVRPGPGCNHLAWQLGHLIDSNTSILNTIAPGAAPALPVGFTEMHSKENAGKEDCSSFLKKSEYEALYKKLDAAVVAAIDKMTETDLDQPSPENWRSMFPRMGDMMVLLVSHSLMHAGQWVPVRRALGKPVVI